MYRDTCYRVEYESIALTNCDYWLLLAFRYIYTHLHSVVLLWYIHSTAPAFGRYCVFLQQVDTNLLILYSIHSPFGSSRFIDFLCDHVGEVHTFFTFHTANVFHSYVSFLLLPSHWKNMEKMTIWDGDNGTNMDRNT